MGINRVGENSLDDEIKQSLSKILSNQISSNDEIKQSLSKILIKQDKLINNLLDLLKTTNINQQILLDFNLKYKKNIEEFQRY